MGVGLGAVGGKAGRRGRRPLQGWIGCDARRGGA